MFGHKQDGALGWSTGLLCLEVSVMVLRGKHMKVASLDKHRATREWSTGGWLKGRAQEGDKDSA